MRVKLTLTLLASTFFLGTQAQITIKQADMPKKYQRYVAATIETDSASNFDATAGGANAVWDLSMVTFQADSLDTISFLRPAEIGYQDSFPSANLVFEEESDGGYIMAQSDENGIKWLGGVFTGDDSSMVIRFDKPLQYIKLPITSTSTHVDHGSFKIVQTMGEPPFQLTITIENTVQRSYEATGYGALKMPNGNSYDVLRLKVVEVDTSKTIVKSPLGSETTTDVEYEYYYEFWANDFGYPLAKIWVDSAYNDTSRVMEILDIENTSLGIEPSIQEMSFSVFPNPTSGQLNVHSPMDGGTVKIYNMAMQEVAVFAPNQTQRQMDVTHLPKGVYVVQLFSASNVPLASEKLVIQ